MTSAESRLSKHLHHGLTRAKATRRRKEAKARAMEAMRTQLLSRLEAVSITVPILNEQELIRLACDHYKPAAIPPW